MFTAYIGRHEISASAKSAQYQRMELFIIEVEETYKALLTV